MIQKNHSDYILTVIILTYNHKDYIETCIKSVLEQKTEYKYKIIIADDCSVDGTSEIVRRYANKHNIIIPIIREENLGVEKNLKNCLKMVNTEYFTILDGDDCWSDNKKIEKQIDLLEKNKDCTICSHNTLVKKNAKDCYFEQNLTKKTYKWNIWNAPYTHTSSRIYRNIIPESEYALNFITYDIFLYYYFLNKGNCIYINEAMSVYNASGNGIFSRMSAIEKHIDGMIAYLKLDLFFNYKYHGIFSKYYIPAMEKRKTIFKFESPVINNRCIRFHLEKIKKTIKGKLFLFYDDLPNDMGMGFQSAECHYLLNNIEYSVNYTKKYKHSCKKFYKKMEKYRKIYPYVPNRFNVVDNLRYCYDLAYGPFLNNIYNFYALFEENNIPFIFELYPGGGFEFNNKISDDKLKRVMQSYMFKKVVVTMPAIKDYLLKNNFCDESCIEYIYGGIPQNNTWKKKQLYKKDKATFDICFVAHKYTKVGEDKGYDIFIEVAKKLFAQNSDIHFHIVGPWENVINTNDINPQQIHFYGIKEKEFFVDFYSKMDIFVSPNRYSEKKGYIDGFPLGIEAGLAGVYMMVTDPLNMKQNTPLRDCEGVEIISTDVNEIVVSVLEKIKNLSKLYADTQATHRKFIEIFDAEKQLKKRLHILQKVLREL